jgi:hypothetical protein
MFKMLKIVAIETAKVTAQLTGVLFVTWITTAIVLDRTLGETMRESQRERQREFDLLTQEEKDRRVREWYLSLFAPPHMRAQNAPTFIATSLLPKPYNNGNDGPGPNDNNRIAIAEFRAAISAIGCDGDENSPKSPQNPQSAL